MNNNSKQKAAIRKVAISKIIVDLSISARVQLNEETIFNYSQSLANGDQFPPIELYYDGKKYWIGDGTHRLEAYKLEGYDKIPAKVFKGGRNEALIHAAGSNVKHGLLRNNRDKRFIVENVLKDEELGQYSDNKIASICAVSQPFVSKVRKVLTYNGYKFPEKRTTSNGRQMDIANIGSKRAASDDASKTAVGSAPVIKKQETGTPDKAAPPIENPDGNPPPKETKLEANPDQAEEDVKAEGNDETTKEASEETSLNKGDEALTHKPETSLPQIGEDIPALKAKVTELQEALKAKDLEIQEQDRIIEDLEAKIWVLENDKAEFEKEIEKYEREEHAREQAKKNMIMAEEAAA